MERGLCARHHPYVQEVPLGLCMCVRGIAREGLAWNGALCAGAHGQGNFTDRAAAALPGVRPVLRLRVMSAVLFCL